MTIESILEAERDTFEEIVYRRYMAERIAGTMLLDSVEPVSREGLCWRGHDGQYGVERINMAWWGWRARAMAQIVREQSDA